MERPVTDLYFGDYKVSSIQVVVHTYATDILYFEFTAKSPYPGNDLPYAEVRTPCGKGLTWLLATFGIKEDDPRVQVTQR
jgi:hypothetical protein